jgi:hypothetical protein
MAMIGPDRKDLQFWRFSDANVLCVRAALRLQRDLDINLAVIGSAFGLLE